MLCVEEKKNRPCEVACSLSPPGIESSRIFAIQTPISYMKYVNTYELMFPGIDLGFWSARTRHDLVVYIERWHERPTEKV